MPTCNKCKFELEGDEKFCPQCGLMLETAKETPSREIKDKKPANKTKIALIALAVALVIGFSLYGAINHWLKAETGTPAAEEPVREDVEIMEEEVEDEEVPVGPLDTGGETSTYTVVGLFPLSGPLSIFGENSAETARLAETDINSWLALEGANWRFNLEIEDTQTSPSTALNRMQSQHDNNVNFFIGPQSSGNVEECLSYANANEILFISPSSTAPALAIADDWLFRFCADDQIQGPAIALLAQSAGVEHLIFGWRDDYWGGGVKGAAAAAAQELGISIYPQEIRYDPSKSSFSNEVMILNDYVSELIDQGVQPGEIGFNLIAFDEATPFLAEAARYTRLAAKYAALEEIIWIGSDGSALSESLKNNSTASKFAADVKFISPLHRQQSIHGEDSYYWHVNEQTRYSLGREIDSYAYITYDIAWVLAQCIHKVGYDPAAVKDILPQVTDDWTKLHGASSHIILNEAGDRAFADFDYWVLNNSLQWENVGYLDSQAGKINWSRNIF